MGTLGRGKPPTGKYNRVQPPSPPKFPTAVPQDIQSRLQSLDSSVGPDEPPSRRARPSSSGRPTTRSMRRENGAREEAAGTGRTTRAIPQAKKSNTLLIVGGGAGGLLLLIVIIAVAASGGSRPAPPPPKKQAVAVVEEEKPKEKAPDTGAIIFICSGSDKHDEKEISITRCKCDARARFYWDFQNRYVCWTCKAAFPEAEIKCPDCGKAPKKHRIKPRPD